MKKLLVVVFALAIVFAATAQPDLQELAKNDPASYEQGLLSNPSLAAQDTSAYSIALWNDPTLAGRNLKAFESAIAADISVVNSNPEAFRIYSNTRGVNIAMLQGSQMQSFSNGIFRTAGRGSTEFRIEDVQMLMLQKDITKVMVDSEGRLVLTTTGNAGQAETGLISNANINNGIITPTDKNAFVIIGDLSLSLEKGSITLTNTGFMVSEHSSVMLDTTGDARFDTRIAGTGSFEYKNIPGCTDRTENCISIGEAQLTASGSGFDIQLMLDDNGKPLYNVRQANVFQAGESSSPEIRIQEMQNGKVMSTTAFSNLGMAFENGIKPLAINTLFDSYTDTKGKDIIFAANRAMNTAGSWVYSFCLQESLAGDCVIWGQGEILTDGLPGFGNPLISEEMTYGSRYVYETEKDGTVNVMIFNPRNVDIIPYISKDENGKAKREFLGDMAADIDGQIVGGINGVMYNTKGTPYPTEAIIINGKLEGNKRGWTSGFFNADSAKITPLGDANDLSGVENGIAGVQALKEGEITSYSTNGCQNTRNGFCGTKTQRTAIGTFPDGRVVVMTLDKASIGDVGYAMKNIGATDAITLDGGGSTRYLWKGEEIHHRETENRAVNSGLFFVAG